MKYCKNNLTFGRVCLCGFRKLPIDYFYDHMTDKMSNYCHACREEAQRLYWGDSEGNMRKSNSGRISTRSKLDRNQYAKHINQEEK